MFESRKKNKNSAYGVMIVNSSSLTLMFQSTEYLKN